MQFSRTIIESLFIAPLFRNYFRRSLVFLYLEYNRIFCNFLGILLKVGLSIRTSFAALVCDQFSRSFVMKLWCISFILNPMIFSQLFHDDANFVCWKGLHSLRSFVITFCARSLWHCVVFFYSESRSIFCNFLWSLLKVLMIDKNFTRFTRSQ